MPVSRHSSGDTSSASIALSVGGVSRQSSLQSLGAARPLSHEWQGGADEVDASGRSAIGELLGASGVMSGPRRPGGAGVASFVYACMGVGRCLWGVVGLLPHSAVKGHVLVCVIYLRL